MRQRINKRLINSRDSSKIPGFIQSDEKIQVLFVLFALVLQHGVKEDKKGQQN